MCIRDRAIISYPRCVASLRKKLRTNKKLRHVNQIHSNPDRAITACPPNLTCGMHCKMYSACQAVILNQLYNATSGPSWEDNSGWPVPVEPGPCDSLFILNCNIDGEITDLRLSYNGLKGTIPSALDDLTKLTNLDLSHNQLSGTISSGLGALGSGGSLDMSGNKLSGTVPGAVCEDSTCQLSQNELTCGAGLNASCIAHCGLGAQCGNAVTRSEAHVLMELYHAMGGKHWANSTGWVGTENVCSWYGVTCNKAGVVTGLDLKSNKLRGTIPPSLSSLTGINNVVLSANQLSGTVPSRLVDSWDLPDLIIMLTENNLTGTVPQRMCDAWFCGLDKNPQMSCPHNSTCVNRCGLVEQCGTVRTRREQSILMTLYNSTNGKNWTNSKGWGERPDPCGASIGMLSAVLTEYDAWSGVTCNGNVVSGLPVLCVDTLSLIHISEPTRLLSISYAVFCLKKKKKTNHPKQHYQYNNEKLICTIHNHPKAKTRNY
eukprot:TRINITY_DN9538_c0_g1_i7.p1 TRINITY_DN9538_c0_g1~~TRINITY_DN9538_c0_g1_i7.p1  ORF type:complete len:488 (-),score=35.60 TRINITY_DN9538_c0_g1_i7:21-1484(-)